jgi:holo-[acyl-carrier protein] synthase
MALIGTMRIRDSILRRRASTPQVPTPLAAQGRFMIVGIGIDLAEVERYRFDERALAWFARKVYTEEEMAYALRKRHWAERLAGFFAAKEATRKAFGHAIPWREVGVSHERSGKPILRFYGRVEHLAASRSLSLIHLTITHSATTAAAVVILER